VKPCKGEPEESVFVFASVNADRLEGVFKTLQLGAIEE
jgi:hypothetical protein